MQIILVIAMLLPCAAAQAGGADCAENCYGHTCPTANAMWGDATITDCSLMAAWGCDCTGCDCAAAFDIDTIDDVPGDYACAATEFNDLSCDELAYFGWNCHYMETRKGADCSGCLCDEAVLGYEKGDSSCPYSCMGTTCDGHAATLGLSCEHLESSDSFMNCDCSGCACDGVDDELLDVMYGNTDCNGNIFPFGPGLGDETCEDDLTAWTMMASSYNEEYTWFGCLNCPELECDGGDCGDSCDRGETCALPLCELCADEDSVVSPTQFGRSFYCTEDSYTCAPSPAPSTAAPSDESTEATVAAEDGANVVTTATAIFAIALIWA